MVLYNYCWIPKHRLKFREGDDITSYFSRFEMFTQVWNISPNLYVVRFGAVITGKTLEFMQVYLFHSAKTPEFYPCEFKIIGCEIRWSGIERGWMLTNQIEGIQVFGDGSGTWREWKNGDWQRKWWIVEWVGIEWQEDHGIDGRME